MKLLSRMAQVVGAFGIAALLSASPLWGAVSKVNPPSPKTVAANGAKVSLGVLFTEEAGPTVTMAVAVTSNPDEMILMESLKGDGTTVKITKGKGTGKVSFTVKKNGTALSRTATLTINGATYTVNQSGQPCKVTIKQSRALFDFYGGDGSIDVTAPVGCPWSATESLDWVTLWTASGNGNGQVTYTVDENSGKNRSGKIEVATGTLVEALTPVPVAAAKKSSKIFTITQKERKFTGTVKLGTPTPLDTPEKAARAFQGCDIAANSTSLAEDAGDFVEYIVRSVDGGAVSPTGVVSPTGSALKKLQTLADKTGKAIVNAASSGVKASSAKAFYICDSGSATIDGLKFNQYGEVIGAASTVTVTMTDCLVDGTTMNGIVAAKGVSVNDTTGRIAGTFIFGKSPSDPLRSQDATSSMTAYASMKWTAMTASDPFTSTVQANGVIDETRADGRFLVDMKGLTLEMSEPSSSSLPTTYTVNGLLRQTYFTSSNEFVSSVELKMLNFIQTAMETYDSTYGSIALVTVDGMLGISSEPANACIDGTFDIATTNDIKIKDDDLLDGTVTINGATIKINDDGTKTITANGTTEIFSNTQMQDLCKVP